MKRDAILNEIRDLHARINTAEIHRRDRLMGPEGRVPANFGDYGDQVYLAPPTFATVFGIFRSALREAKFKGEADRTAGK